MHARRLHEVSYGVEAVYFKPADVQKLLKLSREPYRTMITLAAMTGLRAGELLFLTVADVDFERLMIVSAKAGRRPCEGVA